MNFNITTVRECAVCGVSNSLKLSDANGRIYPMVFDEGQCRLQCSPWAREDRKTGACLPFRNFLASYDFSPLSAKPDLSLCGDTFLQLQNGETCERFGTFFPASENTMCNIQTCKTSANDKLICQKDLFGKSSCESCSISLCQANRNEDFYFKSCLSICGYRYSNNVFTDAGTNSGDATLSGGSIINGEKAYYVNNKTLTQIECDASDLNIEDKLNDPNAAISACKFCSQSRFFIFDDRVKLCVEAPTNPNRVWRNTVEFVSVGLIDVLSFVMNIMIIMIAVVSALYLSD